MIKWKILEKDTTSLDQSVNLFQEGIQLSNKRKKKINNVEDKVAKILLNGKIEDFDVGEQHE